MKSCSTSDRFSSIIAMQSPFCTPIARSPCTNWFAPASSAPKVTVSPSGSTTAMSLGWACACSQKPKVGMLVIGVPIVALSWLL